MQFDLFCRVIDNFGDIGVCWRLAADLGARGHAVRLFADDASALAWMAPQGAPGVALHPWPAATPAAGEPGDVVIEAFGCELPESFQAAMAQAAQARGRQPLWLNLEYLSAEGYVERCHRLPSPLMSGPAKGLMRWFFYPGFTPATGGLPRESELPARQQAFDRSAWRARHGVVPDALAVSLFCYEPPALPALLAQWQARGKTHVLACPGRASTALRQAIDFNQNQSKSAIGQREQLSISYQDYCPQTSFDEMLWACDLNLVRGEDSLVRALWAGRAMVWHIYPQHDQAHHAKLHAFLDWLQAPASLRHFHLVWNGIAGGALPSIDPAELAQWTACVQQARARLLAQEDLVTQILRFVQEKQ